MLRTGFKKYPVSEFPFDRHVIFLFASEFGVWQDRTDISSSLAASRQQIDFVWRVHRDDDTFYDSMQLA